VKDARRRLIERGIAMVQALCAVAILAWLAFEIHWHVLWVAPLLVLGFALLILAERGGDAVLDGTLGAVARLIMRPVRAHSYTPNFYGDEPDEAPDYSMAEVIAPEPAEEDRQI
jgi:hypothetical protein